MLGLNQEKTANFNASRQFILLSSLYGYNGNVKEEKNGIITIDKMVLEI